MITIERCVVRVLEDLKSKEQKTRTSDSALLLSTLVRDLEALYSKQLEDANFYT